MTDAKTNLDAIVRDVIQSANDSERKELRRWLGILLEIGLFGERSPGNEKRKLDNVQRLALELRSGKPVPPGAAILLAELLDDRTKNLSFRLGITEDKTVIRAKNGDADAMAAEIEVHMITKGIGYNKLNKSNAVLEVAEQLTVDEKTVWRRLKKAETLCKSGIMHELPDFD